MEAMAWGGLVVLIGVLIVIIWMVYEGQEDDESMKQKRKEKDYPSQGGNDGHHDRLCVLECAVKEAVVQISKLTKQGAKLMGELQDLKNTIAEVKVDLANEKAEVATEIQRLKDQIAAGSPVTAADLDELIVSVKEIGAGVKDIFTPPA